MKNKTWQYIKNILFYLLVILLGGYILIEAFFPSNSIDIFGFKSYVVITRSMEPDINVNDMVFVVKIDEEDLKIGDAISFYAYLPTNQLDGEGNTIYLRSVVTHYLGDIQNDGDQIIYKTHGASADPGEFDSWNDASGDPVEIIYDDIIGEVGLVIPFVGILLRVLYNPIMLLLITVNIVIVIIIIKLIKKK